MAGFKKGWTNRTRCKATKRNGQPCGRLAMTRYGLKVCGAWRVRRSGSHEITQAVAEVPSLGSLLPLVAAVQSQFDIVIDIELYTVGVWDAP